MVEDFMTLKPEEAWEKIKYYRNNYYDCMSALYSGDHDNLKRTGRSKSFWRRTHKCKIHMPLAADIAAMSSNLLFAKEPTYMIISDDKENAEGPAQKRLETLLLKNSMGNKLAEAAETCAAIGDVYIKIRWNTKIDYPIIDVVQPDQTWPEYIFGELTCVHFFTDISTDLEKKVFYRAYERYEKGKITMKIFKGDETTLGQEQDAELLHKLGYQEEIKVPIDELLAVHIANIRPNRLYRSSMLGRSDFDGLRDSFDALDETFTSWMRDIRLAKARLIIPAEYLRTKPSDMDEGLKNYGKWDFDEDVETYVAMDINTDTGGGTGITPSQFAIRSQEHMATCEEIIRYILQMAGYSPNTFGFSVEGAAASGVALNIRERKSAITKDKKLTYWQSPLEYILTALIHMDNALYPKAGSVAEDRVAVAFADSMGADVSIVAETLVALTNAGSASTVMKIRMLHPDWDEQQVAEEIERLKQEKIENLALPEMLLGGMAEGAEGEAEQEAAASASKAVKNEKESGK